MKLVSPIDFDVGLPGLENERVGFAESTCDYDELMEGVETVDEADTDGDGDGASSDCVLVERVEWIWLVSKLCTLASVSREEIQIKR